MIPWVEMLKFLGYFHCWRPQTCQDYPKALPLFPPRSVSNGNQVPYFQFWESSTFLVCIFYSTFQDPQTFSCPYIVCIGGHLVGSQVLILRYIPLFSITAIRWYSSQCSLDIIEMRLLSELMLTINTNISLIFLLMILKWDQYKKK